MWFAAGFGAPRRPFRDRWLEGVIHEIFRGHSGRGEPPPAPLPSRRSWREEIGVLGGCAVSGIQKLHRSSTPTMAAGPAPLHPLRRERGLLLRAGHAPSMPTPRAAAAR